MTTAAAELADGSTSVWPVKTRLILLAVLALLIVGLDQATKAWAIEHLKPESSPRIHLGGHLLLQYAENKGAFGSVLGNQPAAVRWVVLTLGCSVLLLGVGGYAIRSQAIDKPSFVALALILSGGIGNLIDRFRFDTTVIDFLYLCSPNVAWLHTNVFNVADVAITGGFVILIIPLIVDLVRGGKPAESSKATA